MVACLLGTELLLLLLLRRLLWLTNKHASPAQ
jgi:hypothetical protein